MRNYGYLALTYVGLRLPLKVMHSSEGYYIGTEPPRVSRRQFCLSHAA